MHLHLLQVRRKCSVLLFCVSVAKKKSKSDGMNLQSLVMRGFCFFRLFGLTFFGSQMVVFCLHVCDILKQSWSKRKPLYSVDNVN